MRRPVDRSAPAVPSSTSVRKKPPYRPLVDAIRQRHSRAIGRICSTRIPAKPRSVFLHSGLKSRHSTDSFPLIADPRCSEAAVRVTCHDRRRWRMTSGVVVVNIELAGAASRVRPFAFGVSFADRRGLFAFVNAAKNPLAPIRALGGVCAGNYLSCLNLSTSLGSATGKIGI
jgi:hypothetical protein